MVPSVRVLCVLGALVLLYPFTVPACAQAPVVVVGADNNFPPFEYVDKNGVPTGYTVDLISAVAKESGLSIRIVSGPWEEIRRQFAYGQIDVLSGMFYSSRRASSIEFSIPHSSVTYSVFVRKGEPQLRSEQELRGHTVWVQQGDIASERLSSEGIRVMPVSDEQAALQNLAAGRGDAVVVAKIVGLYILRDRGIRNLQVAGNLFEQEQYCFAVRRNRGDSLLQKLNEGLTVAKYNGEQERIAGKWLSPWESGGVSLWKVLWTVCSLLGLLALAFVWSWMLRKRVRDRTLSLQAELAERQRAERRILKLNRLYAVTTEVNKVIVRIRDRNILFREICRLCTDHGRFALAWVGWVDDSAHRVPPVAYAGQGGDYVNSIQVSTLEEVPEGRGPTGTAAREGHPVICRDIETDSMMAPWRSAALANNYRSSVAFPLQVEGNTIAVLTLYASEPHFFDDEEELALLNGITRDISFALEVLEWEQRRERAERALHASEERFRTAFEQAAVGMTMCDTETRIQAANSSFCEMLGYSREEILGLGLTSSALTHPEDLVISSENTRRMLSGEVVRGCWEKRYLHKDGHPVWAQVVAGLVRDAGGHPLHFITQIQDISAREEAEEKLREAYDMLEAVFRASPVAIVVHKVDAKIGAWNRACERLFGWTAEEVIGVSAPYVPADKKHEFWAHRNLLLGGEEIVNEELVRQRKDGTLVDVSLSAAMLRDANGHFMGSVAMYTDLTERKRAEGELREAYETLEGIFRASPVAIMVHRLGGVVSAWNKACARMFGWTAEEVLGRMNPMFATIEQEQTAHREMLQRGETILNKEVKRPRKDGSLLDVSVSAAPMQDPEGRVTGSVAVYVDLTEHKRAEEELRQAYEILESIFRASPVAIVVLDAALNVIAWNNASERMFGWTREEVQGRRLPIVPPERWDNARENHDRMLRGEAVFGLEAKAQRKNGALLDISISGAPMRDAEGGFSSGVLVFADITERKRAEAELREAYETVEAIFRASPAAVVALDLEGNVTAWNQASERMFGWTAAEVIGRPLPIVPEDQAALHREIKEQVSRGEGVADKEVKRQRKDGSLLDVSFSVTPFRDAEGRIRGGLSAYADLTERKRLEAQLLQSQKLESVGRLAGGVAHDFNNLLTVINCYSDLLISTNDPASTSQGLREIRKAGEQASSLTRQLLAFSRRQILQPKIFNANTAIQDLYEMLQRLMGEDIEVVVDLDPGLGAIKADPGQLQQVIMNLAVNARDAMPKGGKFAIRTQNANAEQSSGPNTLDGIPSNQVVLVFSDSGCGMDEETQRHIFEPFFTTKEAGKGTGLGLSMVWGIVKQSGGHIRVHSQLGQGASFEIMLPRVDEPEVSEHLPEGAITVQGTETVLLVEDQPQLRQLTSHILKGYGYKVLDAANGLEALRICEADNVPIDIVLTDIVMPEITGIELGRRLRTFRPNLKLVYMSGYTDDVILRQGPLQPDAAYLEKPFTPEGLATKIRQVLGTPAANESAA